ncbi:MAG: hypothetical protein KIG63_00415 [Methanobrevibacter sp.]|nr:hypothetical protein [Methanobrevibacter sp.]
MGQLEENLPKLAKQVLKDEDKVTRELVNVLLNQVYSGQHRSNLKTIVQSALDSEIEKYISAGIIDIDDLEEN